MTRFLPALYAAIASLSVCVTVTLAAPEESSRQVGEIQLEDTETTRRDPYAVAQDSAIEFFNDFAAKVDTLKNRGAAPLSPLSDAALNHLANVYLYCTVRSGTCPLVLDAIIESDIVNAKNGSASICPNMERFWKIWVKNDMEKRQNFLVRTANLSATSDFTRNERPRYLKCRETVQIEIGESSPGAEYFAKRYAGTGGPNDKVKKLAVLLTELKTKVPNIPQALEVER